MKKIFNGFSLIEMMVAVTVVMIVTGIGAANFSRLSKSRNLSLAKKEAVSWLNSARNLAITGQLPDGNLDLKFVKVSVAGAGVTVVGVGKDGTKTFFSSKVTASDDNFTIVAKNNGVNVGSFGFSRGLGRLTDESGNPSDGPITIVLSNGETGMIVISDLGVINEK